jgi:hypothetical protein
MIIDEMKKDTNKCYKINEKGIELVALYKVAELAKEEWNKKLKIINCKMDISSDYEIGMKLFFLARIITVMHNKFNYDSIEYIYGEQISLYIGKIEEYIEAIII